jgi:chromosome segregation ATPase
MEQEATIVQDDGHLDNKALLSTDDLIMRIGALSVEVMHKDRLIGELRSNSDRRAMDALSKASSAKSDAEALRVELEKLRIQLKQAESYKTSHDALSTKHNALSAEHEKVRAELAASQKEAGALLSKVGSLEASLIDKDTALLALEKKGSRASKDKKKAKQ